MRVTVGSSSSAPSASTTNSTSVPGSDGVGGLEMHDEAVDDTVDGLGDPVDLGRAHPHPTAVEGGIGTAGDRAPAALGDA